MSRSRASRAMLVWARRHPRSAVAALLAVVVLALVAHAAAPTSTPTTGGALPTSRSPSAGAPPHAGSSTIPLTQTPADRLQRSTRRALDLLATIAIRGRAPLTGYARSEFGAAWTDDNSDPLGHNGCDTRNDVLNRDLTGRTLKPGSHGCTVLAGTLLDPYTARTIAFRRGESTSGAVQIDHVVALGDAWQTGAQRWTKDVRVDLANDPLNLLAVDGPTNEAKGDGDAATWLPPNTAYRCAYVARQIAVKARYGLWMTRAEDDASRRVLATCPDQTVPQEAQSSAAASSSNRPSTER